MTSPTPTAADPQLQEPTDPGASAADAAAIAVIAAALAALVAIPGLAAMTVAARNALLLSGPGAQIVAILAGRGVSTAVAQATLAMTLRSNPIPHTSRAAPETAAVRRATQVTNLGRRAAYLLNAARRVEATYRRAIEEALAGHAAEAARADELAARRQALVDALAREARYWRAHQEAQRERNAAARRLDDAAATHGKLLGWYAQRGGPTGGLLPSVTKACRKADGANFNVDRRPAIGFPGLGPHVGCRCYSGPPHATDRDVYEIEPE